MVAVIGGTENVACLQPLKCGIANDDRWDLHGIADDNGPLRTHDRAYRSLRQSLTGFVDQQPADASGRQVTEHAIDRSEGRGDHRHDEE